MAGFYRTFTRTPPAADEAALLTSLRGLDATAGPSVTPDGTTVTVKKSTPWTAPQITAAQNAIDTAPARTTQTLAQAAIDVWIAAGSPDALALKALVLALIDETNRLRAALRGLGVANLPDVTPTQALNAVRDKAGTL